MSLTKQHKGFGPFCCALAMITAMALTARASASINLELRPINQVVSVGATVNVGLYAVSDNSFDQTLSAAQVILGWDTNYVQLQGLSNAGAVPLLVSNFTPGDPFNLNMSLLDGDAMWVGLANLGSPVPATPAGVLLTTLQFMALAVTPGTLVNIPMTGGNPVGQTIVFDGTTPNTPVTGTLTGATIQIIPSPAAWLAIVVFATASGRRRRVAWRRMTSEGGER